MDIYFSTGGTEQNMERSSEVIISLAITQAHLFLNNPSFKLANLEPFCRKIAIHQCHNTKLSIKTLTKPSDFETRYLSYRSCHRHLKQLARPSLKSCKLPAIITAFPSVRI